MSWLCLWNEKGPLGSVGQLHRDGRVSRPHPIHPYSMSLLASRVTWPLSPQHLPPENRAPSAPAPCPPSLSIQRPLDRLRCCHRRHLRCPQRCLLRATKMQFEMHDNVKGKGGITGRSGNPSSPWNLAASLPWAPWLRRQTAPACTPEAPEMREPSTPGPDVEKAAACLGPAHTGHAPFPRLQEPHSQLS